jgi:hypothetical protein
MRYNAGIIALFPAIIISSILLMLCIGISQSFLSTLFRTIIFERISQNRLMARICEQRIISNQVQGYVYQQDKQIVVYGKTCVNE